MPFPRQPLAVVTPLSIRNEPYITLHCYEMGKLVLNQVQCCDLQLCCNSGTEKRSCDGYTEFNHVPLVVLHRLWTVLLVCLGRLTLQPSGVKVSRRG